MSNFYIRGYGLGVGIGKVKYMKVKLKKLFRCTKIPGWEIFTGRKYQFSQKLPRVVIYGKHFFPGNKW